MGISAASLSAGSPDWLFAINIIIIGILIAGLSLGIGRALRSRRLWAFGVEELAQAVVNAALLGIIVAWITSADALTSGWADSAGLSCPSISAGTNQPLYFVRCALADTQSHMLPLSSNLSLASYKFGWLSGITVSANVITAKPFSAFSDVASTYWSYASSYSSLLSALQVQLQSLALVAQSAFTVFLPTGLMLRMFFATRKLGGALMAAAIGFYIVYPLAYSSLLAPKALFATLDIASASVGKTLAALSGVPIVDLNKEGEVASLITSLSGGNLPALSTAPFESLAAANASLNLALFIYPLACLAITAVAIRELYIALSAEFNLNLFDAM